MYFARKYDFYVLYWRRDRHFTWSFEPREDLAICRAKAVISFLSYFKTLSQSRSSPGNRNDAENDSEETESSSPETSTTFHSKSPCEHCENSNVYSTLIMKCPKCFRRDNYKICPICDHHIPEERKYIKEGFLRRVASVARVASVGGVETASIKVPTTSRSAVKRSTN